MIFILFLLAALVGAVFGIYEVLIDIRNILNKQNYGNNEKEEDN